jgi:hypothetical protein
MPNILQRLNVLAISLLAPVLTSVLVAQIKPGVRPTAQAGSPDEEGVWPKTLQVSPSEPGDPVKLVKIIKGDKEIVLGAYIMPEASGPYPNLLDDWVKDMTFVLENDSSKTIVSVGIAIVFPFRRTGQECAGISAPGWCDAHPHWCDGGCPNLIEKSLHWGRLPAETAKALKARYAADGRGIRADYPEPWSLPLQGRGPLLLAPGWQIPLSPADAGNDEAVTDPRKPFSGSVFRRLQSEGLEEPQGTEPCENGADSEVRCGFRAVPKFNVGIVVVYFEDGTIWGSFGFGYGHPNSDGIFARVSEQEFLGGIKSIPR